MRDAHDAQFEAAVRSHREGRLADAEAGYSAFLRRRPNDPAAWSNYGDVLRRLKRAGDAIAACERAVATDPAFAAGHHNLALALLDAGEFDRAADALQRCVDLQLRTPAVLLNLGNAMRRAGRVDAAIKAYREALQLNPASADAWNNLGSALESQDKLDEAAEAFDQAIRHRLGLLHAHSNLGNVRRAQGRLEEASQSHCRALALDPNSPEALCNFGSTLQLSGKMTEAEEAFRRAIALRPDFPLAHANLAAMLLMRGDYEAGWREHEWRLADGREQRYEQPRWDGGELAGRTILLHSEQGYGDTVQFVRYVPLVARRGGRIVLACQPPLKRLLSRMADVAQVVTFDEALPPFDCHLSLMSAPFIFQTRVQTIPADVPYLRIDGAKAAAWRQRVDALGPGLKVGLTWTGNPRPDPSRTVPAALLGPLAECESARFISLQKDAQRNPVPAEFSMVDWTSELRDFDDTAALASAVDLVISIETVMAHLGGALGKPTWTLLPFMAGWRWMERREDSPWYPTMRLFRQPARGDWAGIERVANELAKLSDTM